jgi:transposase
VTGYSAYWIGQIARRYNTVGPDGVRDQRRYTQTRYALLSEEQHAALRSALVEPHPAGDHWCGRTVAAWLSVQLGRRVSRQAGWRVLRQLGARFLKPRPRHVQADAVARASFKARLRPLLREVATAFPHARVELWAVEIVCTQMTKTDLRASRRGRDDIADLHLLIRNHHAVNEQFDELTLVLERGRSEALAHALTELLHARDERRCLLVALCVDGEVEFLLCQRLLLLREVASPSLVLE